MRLHSIFSLLVLFGSHAHGADLKSIQACVSEGYGSLKNRHGIAAAVLDSQGQIVSTYGAATQDQIFEIGSITKTFTATLLAQAVVSGSIKVSDPIPAVYQKAGSTITYQELTTHTSGIIEGVFADFKITNPLAPFDGLTIPLFKQLYSQTHLASVPGTSWAYSNIGVSLLGLILAERNGMSYEELVREKILKPLKLDEMYFEVPSDKLSHYPQGLMTDESGKFQPIPHWNLYKTAIAPAGGLNSTIASLAKYARANLAPESTSLAQPIALAQQQLYYIADHKMGIGMNWILQPDVGLIWHNGETYGFNSILAISKTKNVAVVAMTDTVVAKKDAQGNTSFDTSIQDVAFRCLK